VVVNLQKIEGMAIREGEIKSRNVKAKEGV